MLRCVHCSDLLTGRQRKHCSPKCRSAVRWAAQKKNPPGERWQKLSAEKVAEVHVRFPSTARDWDTGMVEEAWPRLAPLLTRRLERLTLKG